MNENKKKEAVQDQEVVPVQSLEERIVMLEEMLTMRKHDIEDLQKKLDKAKKAKAKQQPFQVEFVAMRMIKRGQAITITFDGNEYGGTGLKVR